MMNLSILWSILQLFSQNQTSDVTCFSFFWWRSSRSRLADFHMNCQMTPHTVTSCPHDNYHGCLMSYVGLIGTFNILCMDVLIVGRLASFVDFFITFSRRNVRQISRMKKCQQQLSFSSNISRAPCHLYPNMILQHHFYSNIYHIISFFNVVPADHWLL